MKQMWWINDENKILMLK